MIGLYHRLGERTEKFFAFRQKTDKTAELILKRRFIKKLLPGDYHFIFDCGNLNSRIREKYSRLKLEKERCCKMRIGFGGISHETNTFSSVSSTLEKFQNDRYRQGEDVIRANTGVRTYAGGFIDEAKALKIDFAFALTAGTTPSGLITKDALETMLGVLVDDLQKMHAEKPLDGIALTLHGAGTADGYPDIEGEIIRTVREAFGKDMPIGVVLDLHGNITDTMMEHADILLGVKGYPHVDSYERARDLVRHLHNMITTGEKPAKRLIKLPWVFVPAKAMTVAGPAHEIQQFCLKLEAEDDELLQSTFFHGFPYADVAHASVSVATVAKTQEAADRNALKIAEFAWAKRAEFISKMITPAEAFDKALELGVRPIVINESSDNPGGGTPGDGTHLLREMLKRNLPDTAFGFITDPEVAKQAAEAGVGATISCRLGGKIDGRHGEPIEIEEAYVKGISDGKFVLVTPMGAGTAMSLGLTARLQVGNVDIVVGSIANQTRDKCPFELMGIDYERMHILGLKSTQHFRGWWESRAAICPCDPPGIHCGDLSTFDFKHLNKTYYPFDPDRVWNPENA